MQKILKFLKDEKVLVVAWILAIATEFMVPIDKTYGEYIHWNTLALLLMLLLVMEGFKSLGVLTWLGEKLLRHTKNTHQLAYVLVLCCFFSGMIVTNDVSLITFVPFAIVTLKMAEMKKMIVPVVALQSIAANLGAMLTPIGNPHNIYFYFLVDVSPWEFMSYTLPYCILGFVLLTIATHIGKSSKIDHIVKEGTEFTVTAKFRIYLVLFGVGLFSLTKIVPTPVLAAAVVVVILIADRGIFRKVDYSLIFTFIGFFIFVGNMQRIDQVADFVSGMIEGREMLVTVGLCQVISNLPTALLLSGFTEKWQILMIGTDIGGMGTLIASMANLISYKAMIKEDNEIKHGYVKVFSVMCIIFLIPEVLLYYAMI